MKSNFDKAMRWAQLTICEGDVNHFDPDEWLKYMDDAACDGLVLSTGGYIAYHNTKIPYHYSVKHPDHEDIFGYMVEACRKKGYSIICRSDAHAFHDDAFQAHPEWAAYTADGKPRAHSYTADFKTRDYWNFDKIWVADVLGPYGFEFMTEVHKEISANYDIDGIFCNRWAGSGVCFCDRCRAEFKEATGYDLPAPFNMYRNPNMGDPATGAYVKWHNERVMDLCRTWDHAMQAVNPNVRFIPNSTVGLSTGLDNKMLADYSDVLFADRQGREGRMTPWFNGRNGKEMRAVMGQKPIGGIFSTGLCEKRWKDSTQEKAELDLWVSEAVANGLRPWFTKFSMQVFDKRWMPVISDLYNKYKLWEPALRGMDSKAEVAVMLSQHSAKQYAGGQMEKLLENPINGFYQALIEARIPFDMMDSHYIQRECLSRYKAVILPNIAVLSDKDCEELKAYVAEGGAVLATYETSLYDENGKKRDNFGLAELFGVNALGGTENNLLNGYITVNSSVGDKILSKGLEEAGHIIGCDNYVKIEKAADDFEPSPFKPVPAYPDLPMEECYPRWDLKAEYEEVLCRKYGKGRVIYMCGDLDRSFWDYLAPDTRKVLTNSVRWLLDGNDIIRVEGSGLIDATIWENDNCKSIHLVNLTSVNAMRGMAHEVLPLHDVVLYVRKDFIGDLKATGYENPELTVECAGDYAKITIPVLKLHELITLK